MASLLARIKTAFHSATQAKSGLQDKPEQAICVIEPSTFTIENAANSFYSTLFGKSAGIDSLTLPEKLTLDAVSQSLSQQGFRLKAVPRLPSVIPKLLRSLRDDSSSAADFVNIINKDPTMSTAVLKLANSVYFNHQQKRITSIDVAVVKLGTEGLRCVLSAAVMQPVIARKCNYFASFGHKLWDHSLCCAVACEIIAKAQGLEPFKAYLLGLVHDMGKITIFSELARQFELNEGTATAGEQQPGYAAFAPLMQTLSPALTLTIARDWQLPEEICEALQQQIDISSGKALTPYAHILYQANLACEIYSWLEENTDNRQQLQKVAERALQEMSLPLDLFQQLDSIAMEVLSTDSSKGVGASKQQSQRQAAHPTQQSQQQ